LTHIAEESTQAILFLPKTSVISSKGKSPDNRESKGKRTRYHQDHTQNGKGRRRRRIFQNFSKAISDVHRRWNYIAH
jgi:hypothetical protein